MKNFSDIMPFLKSCEDHLLQVISYSNAFGEQQCVIIFDAEPQNYLELLRPLRTHLRVKRLPLPLVINKDFILTSLDSYPLEFIDMSSQYHDLYCREDILATLHFDKRDVRLQIERELKSKLLLTRMAILDSPNSKIMITRVLKQSIRAIIPALKGQLYLAGRGIPNNLPELLHEVESVSGIKLELIQTLSTQARCTISDVYAYLDLLNKLLTRIDGMANDLI